VVGDGEAETGPLATGWQINKFLNPITDGAVLPILHLNGFKIANPTVLSRIPHEELEMYMRGAGWKPHIVEGDDPKMHKLMADALDEALDKILAIQKDAREAAMTDPPAWPMIVLRTPKGWTGPKEVDGKTSRAASAPTRCPSTADTPEHLKLMEDSGCAATSPTSSSTTTAP
jgi:xylulose-5-phosphate/fructose-6-phosphate phosphoketolase